MNVNSEGQVRFSGSHRNVTAIQPHIGPTCWRSNRGLLVLTLRALGKPVTNRHVRLLINWVWLARQERLVVVARCTGERLAPRAVAAAEDVGKVDSSARQVLGPPFTGVPSVEVNGLAHVVNVGVLTADVSRAMRYMRRIRAGTNTCQRVILLPCRSHATWRHWRAEQHKGRSSERHSEADSREARDSCIRVPRRTS
jgi:hypothetical protein